MKFKMFLNENPSNNLERFENLKTIEEFQNVLGLEEIVIVDREYGIDIIIAKYDYCILQDTPLTRLYFEKVLNPVKVKKVKAALTPKQIAIENIKTAYNCNKVSIVKTDDKSGNFVTLDILLYNGKECFKVITVQITPNNFVFKSESCKISNEDIIILKD